MRTGIRLDEGEVGSHVTQSIVVRLWLESPEPIPGPSDWRARITHVPTGESRTVDSITGIARFCAGRLIAMNARLRWYERAWARIAKRSSQ